MKRKRSFLVFVFWLCLSSLGAQQTLNALMEQLLQDDLLKVSDVGIAVFDLTDSVSVYTYREHVWGLDADHDEDVAGLVS